MGRKESNQTNKYLSKFQVNTVTKIEVIWKNVLSRARVMVIGVSLTVCFCCFTSHVNSYGHCGTVFVSVVTLSKAEITVERDLDLNCDGIPESVL